MAKVMVYSTPTCPHCRQAKKFLSENNVDYEYFDVASDKEKAAEMRDKSGALSVPVIDVNGTIIVGFNEAVLRKALNPL